jgi:hypothetical protein
MNHKKKDSWKSVGTGMKHTTQSAFGTENNRTPIIQKLRLHTQKEKSTIQSNQISIQHDT